MEKIKDIERIVVSDVRESHITVVAGNVVSMETMESGEIRLHLDTGYEVILFEPAAKA